MIAGEQHCKGFIYYSNLHQTEATSHHRNALQMQLRNEFKSEIHI